MISLHRVRAIAENVVRRISPFCERIAIAGSIRRTKEEVKDIEIVAIPKWNETTVAAGFFDMKTERTNLLWQELHDSEIRWIKTGTNEIEAWHIKPEGKYWRGLLPTEIKLDLFLCTPENWGIIFAIRTGSADFSARLMTVARNRGYQAKDGFLWRSGERLETREEIDVFNFLNLKYVEPEMRIDGNAIQFKSQSEVPQ